jgi:hypothetical protein
LKTRPLTAQCNSSSTEHAVLHPDVQVYIANLALDAQESAVKALASTVGEVGAVLLQSWQCGMGVDSWLHSAGQPVRLESSATVFAAVLQPPVPGHNACQHELVAHQTAMTGCWKGALIWSLSAVLQIHQLRLPKMPDGRNKG